MELRTASVLGVARDQDPAAPQEAIMHTKTWQLTINLFEGDDRRTRAEAVLRTDAGTELRHEGWSRRNPADRDIPEIGDELAACRALTGLAHDLLEASLADIAAADPAGGEPQLAVD